MATKMRAKAIPLYSNPSVAPPIPQPPKKPKRKPTNYDLAKKIRIEELHEPKIRLVMPPVEQGEQKVSNLHIFRAQGQLICHECFNKLSNDERRGRIGYGIGFVPEGTPISTCSLCNREGYNP